jgi:hypothetical protein
MTDEKYNAFKSALGTLINEHSMENNSNTPDFILADYLVACLKAYDDAISRRGQWYNYKEEQTK